MKKVKIAFEKSFFKQVKGRIDPRHYVECGRCGAAEVDGRELIRAIYEIALRQMPDYESDDDASDIVWECLARLTEAPPNEFPDWTAFERWESENAHRICRFLDDVYGQDTCAKYDKVILFFDSGCDCFRKDKVESI